ncbi:KN motif and ankyrin repeat domain-containing protein [Dirofilaria immitis]
MAARRVNGHVEETPMTTTSKCNCCPYGFHIDLGFVDFVENFANETSTGMTMNDRSGLKKNSLKYINSQNNTDIKQFSITNIEKAPFSPSNCIFSDSLENVVSDFEEVLNLRECSSERGSRNPLKNARKSVRCNGYFSDYGTTQMKNRPLPPRIHVALSSRKPLFASEVQQYGYRTALGRAMSEIKSKHQNDEINNNFRKTLFTANDSRVRNVSNIKSRSYDIDLSQEVSFNNLLEYNHSLYEQGKTHFLGSRTPDLPRRSFTLVPSQNQYPIDTESMHQPQWRIRSSVERSSSAVDIDRFTSMRRRKEDENNISMNSKPTATLPISYPRNRSLFSERLRRDHSSPPHLSLNSPPSLSLSFSTTEKYLTSRDLSDVKTTARTCARNTSSGVIENDFMQLMNGDTLAVGSKDSSNDVNVRGLCFQCCNLQKQLSDLSCRLKQVTEEIKSRTAKEELGKKRKVVGKSIGNSYEMFDDVIAEKIKVENKDAASDALLIEVENKRTSVSLKDRIEMKWCNDIASSPVPGPPQYSIGAATDKSLTFSPFSDATIDSPNQELLNVRPVCHVECGTEPILTKDYGCGTYIFAMMCDSSSMTDAIKLVDSGTGCKQTISLLKDSYSMTAPITSQSRHIQTEHIETRTMSVSTSPVYLLDHSANTTEIIQKDSYTICDELMACNVMDAITETDNDFIDENEIRKEICCDSVALQTEFEPEQNEPRIIDDTEIAESLWLIQSRDRKDVAVGNEDDVIEELKITSAPDNNKLQRELIADSDDDDTICVVEEMLSDPEDIDFESSKFMEQMSSKQRADNLDIKTTNEMVTELKAPRTLGHARAAIVKKMLTEKSQPLSFIRGTMTSKSWRSSSKKGDSLQYIVDQHKTQSSSAPSIPQTKKGALKKKVNLKKDIATPQIPLSKFPEPVPARIPRPKISKYIPGETVPQSPDEEAEIADRLTPLRSEMRTLRTYSNGRAVVFSRIAQPLKNSSPRISFPTYDKKSDPIIFEDSTSSSSDSEGSYDTNEAGTAAQFELTPQLSEAIEILKKYIQKSDSVEPVLLDWATKHAKHEWLKTAARKTASAIQVEGFIDFLEEASDAVLKFIINLADPNENTALHYAISHGNFDVVSVLLDSRVCNLDRANKAGYTAVMLASLCDAFDEVEAAVIHRLFQLGDVNAQAVQHGQTALMLAVSHGKINTTKLLIDCQADLNIQDEEGSTALMCAAEHGHKEIVKLLLAQQDIDASLSDCDSSTALSIAVENGHRDIGVLIYAHLNHSYKQNQQKIESSS